MDSLLLCYLTHTPKVFKLIQLSKRGIFHNTASREVIHEGRVLFLTLIILFLANLLKQVGILKHFRDFPHVIMAGLMALLISILRNMIYVRDNGDIVKRFYSGREILLPNSR